jgi:hypothetical protein
MNIEEIVTQPIAQGSPGPCPAPIHANLSKARQTDRGLDRRESLQRAYRTDLAAHDGACSQKRLTSGLNCDFPSSSVPAMKSFLPVPSFSIRMGEPHLEQKRRCIASPL